jgi:hypothetical protein
VSFGEAIPRLIVVVGTDSAEERAEWDQRRYPMPLVNASVIADALPDGLLAGVDPKTALEPHGLLDSLIFKGPTPRS